MNRQKNCHIIIDCDTGIDDALALLMALQQDEWTLHGITAVSGNVPVELTASNTIRICTLAGRRVPVYSGAAGPLYRPRHTSEYVHGANGLGGVELPSGYEPEAETALSFLTRTARELNGELELITLGPLTNIALAILTDPGFAPAVRHLTMMGGALHGGNVQAQAEFNIYADPEAARIVFHAGIPLTMVGLDVTNRALLPHAVVDRWRHDTHPIIQAAGSIIYGYRRFLDGIGADLGTPLHDPLAMGAGIDPAFITTRRLFVEVEQKSSRTLGKTIGDELEVTGREANAEVAVDLEAERFVAFFIDSIEKWRMRNPLEGVE